MKSITGKELCKMLEKKGWQLKNIKGSHHVYMKSGRRERISVPVHSNKDLKIGLLKAVMKIAEINEDEL
jgi:predicted RNA binding protein YcfA (HicA-like mRNA interferase family)